MTVDERAIVREIMDRTDAREAARLLDQAGFVLAPGVTYPGVHRSRVGIRTSPTGLLDTVVFFTATGKLLIRRQKPSHLLTFDPRNIPEWERCGDPVDVVRAFITLGD